MSDVKKRSTLRVVLLFAIACASGQSPGPGREHAEAHAQPPRSPQSALAVPASIRREHQHLHHQLHAAIAAGGTTGERAEAVAEVLDPHFEDEEAYAMPPLGLLGAFARGEPIPDEQVRQAIAMAARLRAEYDEMLAEHEQIHAALKELAVAAREEHKEDHAAFAEALMLHAGSEEGLLYPTTLLIGEYLELRQRADE
jgi:hypothetical protein